MMHLGGLIPVIRAYGTWLWPILFTYTTILPIYPVVCLQRNFVQSQILLVVPYRIIIYGYALNMSCNKYCRMVTSFLSGFQSLVQIDI